jgi:oxalate decarboxylase/phosphoglucose isomerase-like protein (cupin superfamily)
MPIADEMAGVNMRLKVGAVRELHWHNTAEVRQTSYMEHRIDVDRIIH